MGIVWGRDGEVGEIWGIWGGLGNLGNLGRFALRALAVAGEGRGSLGYALAVVGIVCRGW